MQVEGHAGREGRVDGGFHAGHVGDEYHEDRVGRRDADEGRR